MLLSDPKGHYKYIGNDILMYGETQFFWPPPLVDLYDREADTDVSTASSLWVAKSAWVGGKVEKLVKAVQKALGEGAQVGAFRICKTSLQC